MSESCIVNLQPQHFKRFEGLLIACDTKGGENLEKELLFEGKETASSVNLKEFSLEGAKIDINLAGKISGRLNGTIMTTHNITMKQDGTSQVDLRSLIFSGGEPVFVMGNALGKIVAPSPMREIEENLTFQTPSQRLSYLNTTKGWSKGFFNPETGEYSFKVYTVK